MDLNTTICGNVGDTAEENYNTELGNDFAIPRPPKHKHKRIKCMQRDNLSVDESELGCRLRRSSRLQSLQNKLSSSVQMQPTTALKQNNGANFRCSMDRKSSVSLKLPMIYPESGRAVNEVASCSSA